MRCQSSTAGTDIIHPDGGDRRATIEPMPADPTPHRRDLLTGKALRASTEGASAPDSPIGHLNQPPPESRDTLRLTARAMACDFSIIMNAGEHQAIWHASTALDRVGLLEAQLSVYRDDSEVSELNATASTSPVVIESQLFALLQQSVKLAQQTHGAFDLTTDPLIRLWRQCREEIRIPTEEELATALADVGMENITLDATSKSIELARNGSSINLGAIGKGFALDRVAEELAEQGSHDFLLHGGHSSLYAKGQHANLNGWPVGIGNPLFTDRRLGTILLQNQAMGTSGSNIQYFRVGERRYGHILDPRTGWPAEGHLSVTVIAPTAAEADALSTAFYVMAPEEVTEYCTTNSHIGAIMIPLPERDRRVRPTTIGVDPNQVYWDADQVLAE